MSLALVKEPGERDLLHTRQRDRLSLGPFPMIALAAFVTYVLLLETTIMALAKRWGKRLRRVPFKVHRAMGILAILLATLHQLMGVSAYV